MPKTPEKYLIQKKQYYLKHRDALKEYQRIKTKERYNNKREEILQKKRENYQRDPAKMCEYVKKCFNKNREVNMLKRRESARRFYDTKRTFASLCKLSNLFQ